MQRDGTNVALRSKTFAVLEYLATHRDRLVARDELLDAVWPQTHVTPSVLAGCICELRHALGDDARAARFIETAHRRGYRFVAAGRGARPARAPRPPRSPDPDFPDVELATLARRFAEVVTQIIEQRRQMARVHRPHKPGGRTAVR